MLCHAAHLMFYYEKEIKNLSVTYASSFRVNFQSSVGRADHLPVKTDHSIKQLQSHLNDTFYPLSSI